MKKHYWCNKVDGKIANVKQFENDTPPNDDGKTWYKCDKSLLKAIGDPFDWLVLVDGVYRHPEDDELVALGKRFSKRGKWYDKETREEQTITKYDVDPGDGWTQTAPIAGERFQKWNEQKKKWEIETDKKERAEKEKHLGELKAQLETIDRESGAGRASRVISIEAAKSNGLVEDCAGCANMQHHCACCREYCKLVKAEADASVLRPEVSALEAELRESA